MDSARIIVGLGNPGRDYERTRHNVGFMIVDAYAAAHQLSWSHEPTLKAMVAEGNVNGVKTVCVKPTTYMNASGEAVRRVLDRFHVLADRLLVISDDVDLPLGTIRCRHDGSAGGHNGLKSIIALLGISAFRRMKIGVSAPPPNVPLEEYVLQKFVKEEHGVIDRVVAQAVEILVTGDDEKTTTWTV